MFYILLNWIIDGPGLLLLSQIGFAQLLRLCVDVTCDRKEMFNGTFVILSFISLLQKHCKMLQYS